MMEVTVAKRRRSWEWRVHDQNGTLIMHGRERTRPAARYQGYRTPVSYTHLTLPTILRV